MGISVWEKRAEPLLIVGVAGRKNRFLPFGGRDESSAALIQGSTLAGILLDEAVLLQINGDSLTPAEIDRTIRGCGIRAKALEMGGGNLRVIFPEVAGVPAEFEQIRKIILDILPCHLAVEFYFRYLNWAECEQAGFIWAAGELTVRDLHNRRTDAQDGSNTFC